MLKIVPDDEIVFTKFDNGVIGGEIEILNSTPHPIAFKIKTTSPDKFRVRPSTGTLASGGNRFINVVLQSEQQANASLSKDKFLIMSMELKAHHIEATETEIADLWKKAATTSASVHQHRLMCSFNPNCNLRHRFKKDHASNGFSDNDLHPNNSYLMDQILSNTRRLESQVKLNRGLQLATLFVSLLLLVAALFIIHILLYNNPNYSIKKIFEDK